MNSYGNMGPKTKKIISPHPRVTQVRALEKTFSRMMKGYIALSRVKKVDDLYLPQAFSPALFRQGPQPWPTSLMQYLKGEQDESRLEEMAEEAAQKGRKPRLLKDLKWACGKCARTFDYIGFLVKGKYTGEEWYTAYWEKIVAP